MRRRYRTMSGVTLTGLMPVLALRFCSSSVAASLRRSPGCHRLWVFLPLAAGVALYLLDHLPGRAQGACLVFAVALAGGVWLVRDLSGLNHLFAVLLFGGGMVMSIACFYRRDDPARLLSLARRHAAVAAGTAARLDQPRVLLHLGADHALLVFPDLARRREAAPHALRYLLFSLVAAILPACRISRSPMRRDRKRRRSPRC